MYLSSNSISEQQRDNRDFGIDPQKICIMLGELDNAIISRDFFTENFCIITERNPDLALSRWKDTLYTQYKHLPDFFKINLDRAPIPTSIDVRLDDLQDFEKEVSNPKEDPFYPKGHFRNYFQGFNKQTDKLI